ncbi:MAG: hypothetical protein K6B46_03620 [Opitutales bacterium]|nr:hypothetical protein [Opitutales bacterium]
MIPFLFPSPKSHGQSLPEQQSPVTAGTPENAELGSFLNTLFLSELTLYKDEKDISACAQRLMDNEAVKISDPTLRRKTMFSLARIVKNPGDWEKIRADHIHDLGEYFTEMAFVARDGKRLEDALAAVQIALKCDPANIKARLLFASLIEPKQALQTLHFGIKYLDMRSELAPVYFNRYFDALSDLQQDRLAAKQAVALLKEKLPEEVHLVIANHAAISSFWIGDYEHALQILEDEAIDKSQQGMILKSRCFFELGETSVAIKILEDGLTSFPPEKRDVILSQLSHYRQRMGDLEGALKVAERRIAENPDSATPYLQRLYLFNKMGNEKRSREELEAIFENFASSQTALLSLANLAAETGKPDVAERCLRCAIERNIAPAMFVAAEIEATLTAGDADKAIRDYAAITQAKPDLFDDYEAATKAILAAAYARAATQNKKDEKRLREHSQLLLSQYLAMPDHTPDEFVSVIALLRRVGEEETAYQVASAALSLFPWHSQLRADMISVRIKLGMIEGSATRTALEKEIQVLTQMRRPNPAIWQEVAMWLSTGSGLPPVRANALKKLVAPLARNNWRESRDF